MDKEMFIKLKNELQNVLTNFDYGNEDEGLMALAVSGYIFSVNVCFTLQNVRNDSAESVIKESLSVCERTIKGIRKSEKESEC